MSLISSLQIVASINPRTGGPAVSVTGLAMALERAGQRASIVSLDYEEHGAAIDTPGVANLRVVPSTLGKRLRGWSPALDAAIARAAETQGADLIHHHGLWMYPGIYARRIAQKRDVPLVISPRGMLDRWALERSALRKAVATRVYERRNLRAARAFHATSAAEAAAIRDCGLAQPIAVIPNGVELRPREARAARGLIEASFPALEHKRWLLFMGRLHPKKGLDLLLEAWRDLHRQHAQWQLVVAGPDLDGARPGLERSIADDPTLRASVTFSGMLEGAAKQAALDHAEIFVLPTRSENFGMAVAEALAHGIPVVTTTAAPWPDLVAHECGWWVEPSCVAIADALRDAMGRPAADLQAIGERGRRYASSRFDWDTVGARMADVYRWLVAGGAVPDCVERS